MWYFYDQFSKLVVFLHPRLQKYNLGYDFRNQFSGYENTSKIGYENFEVTNIQPQGYKSYKTLNMYTTEKIR
jgi:hypothetical protein